MFVPSNLLVTVKLMSVAMEAEGQQPMNQQPPQGRASKHRPPTAELRSANREQP